MSQQLLAPVVAAAVTLIVAILGYLAARVQQNTRAVEAHQGVLSALARRTGTRQEGRAALPAGAGGARAAPLWNQLSDPDPSGALPPQRWNDCGEECCAEVIYAQHGVAIEADYLRYQLGGPSRLGTTTPGDLVQVLAKNNVDAEQVSPLGAQLAAELQTATAAGHMAIVLGRFVAPGILHWVLVTRADAAGCSANDPWGGVRRSWVWADFLAAYAGEVVVILRSPDPR